MQFYEELYFEKIACANFGNSLEKWVQILYRFMVLLRLIDANARDELTLVASTLLYCWFVLYVVSELVNNLDHALPVRFVYEGVYIGAICRILEAGCIFLKNFGLIFVAGKIQNQ